MIDEFTLDPEGYIASGRGSLVFNHPNDPKILLKIAKETRPAKLRRRMSRSLRPNKRRLGKFREWHRETEEYIAAMHKIGGLPSCLPAPRGFVQTNLGPAYAVEKISDENSTDLALTIEGYLKDHDAQELRPAIDSFFEYVERYQIIFFDMKLYNLCVVRDASGKPIRIVSIDSIGEATVLQVRKWSSKAYKHWFEKAREKFLNAVYPE